MQHLALLSQTTLLQYKVMLEDLQLQFLVALVSFVLTESLSVVVLFAFLSFFSCFGFIYVDNYVDTITEIFLLCLALNFIILLSFFQ